MSIESILTAAVYRAYLRNIPVPLPSRYQSLSNDELVAVHAYTTDASYNSYADLNYQLRNKSIAAHQFPLIQAISSAIGTIEKDRYAPVYFRYTELGAEQIESIYAVGSIASHHFFTSVSEANANFIGPACNVLLRVIPADEVTPAYIADISKFPNEKEYLYPPNIFFHVLQVTKLERNTFEIFLLERPL
jgi:hypothetical protein